MKPLTTIHIYRTLVYVEGDARMSTYEDPERGTKTMRLDLIQRTSHASRPTHHSFQHLYLHHTFHALSKP